MSQVMMTSSRARQFRPALLELRRILVVELEIPEDDELIKKLDAALHDDTSGSLEEFAQFIEEQERLQVL